MLLPLPINMKEGRTGRRKEATRQGRKERREERTNEGTKEERSNTIERKKDRKKEEKICCYHFHSI